MTGMRLIPSFFLTHPFTWLVDWARGVSLIVLTVVIHVSGLGLIKQKAFGAYRPATQPRYVLPDSGSAIDCEEYVSTVSAAWGARKASNRNFASNTGMSRFRKLT